ncbi:MAG: autotransporter domain-containing protein, partial [Methylococcaceae bacterium]|nr:autotransporter domain-containing protein [Methylococcaceae bacterium]
ASECITTTTTTTTLSTETVNQLPANEKEVATALKSLCDSGDADTDLQARCDSLIADDISVQELTDAMRQVSSMQTSGQATSAIQMLDAYVNTLGSRTQQIRQGDQQGVRLTGLSIKDSHGKSLSTNKLAQINEYLNKGSAGDESEFDKLGFFMNGSYVFGKRDATDKELGFNEYGYSTTLGVDYRILDNLVLGVAFGYTYKNNSYIDSLGTMETDDFSGALYGTFYLDNGFYIDASVSGTSSNYQNQRNINYTANIGITGGEAVDTHTSGENNGHKYNINIASGYDFYMEGLRLSPQLKLNYSNVHIDDLYEQGGQGLALHIEDQDFDALSTSLGFQTSYPFSFSWGVLVPTLAVDWTHEFLYSARTIHANFIQDLGSSKTSFHIFTDNPDRDFVNVSAGASAQLKHGIAMFINYETILAHRHIDSHLFTAGVRIEF